MRSFRQSFALTLIGALGVILTSIGSWLPVAARTDPLLPSAATATLAAQQDSTIAQVSPAANYGDNASLSVTYIKSGAVPPSASQALLKFDLAALPPQATIVQARLELLLERSTGAADFPVQPDAILAAWNESQVTWNNRPAASNQGDAAITLDSSAGWKTWDITHIAQAWASGALANQGLLLRSDGTVSGGRFFASRQNAASAPRLVIEYTLPAPAPTLDLRDVPPGLHRLAAQHLEEVRFSEMAPGWDAARLGPRVHPLYRPDIDGVAYYEFAVVVPFSAGRSAAATQPAGYIIVSTGEHDFPIAHWSFSGVPPTQELEQLARLAGKAPAKFYKLDTLAYAAEDSQGDEVATIGQQPSKIVGLDLAVLEQPAQINESRPAPPAPGAPVTATSQITVGPDLPASLQLAPWESWDALKQGYSESYGVLAEALRREAHKDWQIEQLAEQFGEVLRKGDVRTLGLLDLPTPAVAISGPGKQYIQTDLLNNGRPASGLKITVVNAVVGQELPFEVSVAYGNGASEKTRFVIAEPRTVFLPVLNKGPSGAATGQSGATPGGAAFPQSTDPSQVSVPISEWGSWVYYWAGTHEDQRLYGQMSEFESPNTDDCLSGCGATAWGMLFGWADYKAAQGNAYWTGRWGIYRQNGGTGANEVAPQDFTLGVKKMILKIRDYIATFCLDNSGATFPWDMDQAQGYLNPRSTAVVATTYNSLGIHEDAIRDTARLNITRRHTPAIIGTGWLNHYPLAYGYRRKHRKVKVYAGAYQYIDYEYRHEFYVNQGWAGEGNGWISAGTWFAGSVWPCLENYLSSELGCPRPEPS